ncbi:MAG: histidine phosphatase family protein [Verrucomicrobiota bacterium]
MKEIYLIRHAKSSWDSVYETDYDRPLNERGAREGPQVASFLAKKWGAPGILISSPAIRAYQTAQFFRSSWGLPWSEFSLSPTLYEASIENLRFTVLDGLEDRKSVAIVGHNPGLSILASELCSKPCELKTSCAVRIRIGGSMDPGDGTLIEFVSPRK